MQMKNSLLLVLASGLLNGAASAGVRQRTLKTPDLDDLEHRVKENSNVLHMYQMDTTKPSAEIAKYADIAGVQPFYQPRQDGASGKLTYKNGGWDFTYGFMARGLQPTTDYQLVLQYPVRRIVATIAAVKYFSAFAFSFSHQVHFIFVFKRIKKPLSFSV